VAALKTASLSTRALFALALALLLGVRLLSPPGFMPSFARGAVTITLCPNADQGWAPTGHSHHGGHSQTFHQPCAYAAAQSFGTAAADAALLPGPLLAPIPPAVALPRTLPALLRSHERPPLRGPPVPA